MNVRDNPVASPPSAHAPVGVALNPRGGAQEFAQGDAGRGGGAAEESAQTFAHLVTLMRTSALPGADTTAADRATPARAARSKSRGNGPPQNEDINPGVMTPTVLAEQELRSDPTGADWKQSAQPKEDAPQAERKPVPEGSASMPTRTGVQLADTKPAAQTQPQQPAEAVHSSSVHALPIGQKTQSVGTKPAVNHTSMSAESRQAIPQSSEVSSRGQNTSTHSSNAIHAGTSTSAAQSRVFMHKLAHAAAPARAQLQQREVAHAAASALGIAIKKGGGEVTMRLRPEALGQIRIEVRVRDAKVDASLHAQTDAARELLGDSVPDLRAALEAQGLTVERISVAPAGAPDAVRAQDAQQSPQGTDAHTPLATTPDGTGHPSHQREDAWSAPSFHSAGGDRERTGTDAQGAETSLWEVVPSAAVSTLGMWEWVA